MDAILTLRGSNQTTVKELEMKVEVLQVKLA